jgi:hypothetical protein
MKHLKKYNEGIFGSKEGELYEKPPSEMFNNKTRILIVGGHDYAASEFGSEYRGTKVSDVINNLSDYEGDDWDLKVLEFDKVDQKFADFVRSEMMDYDMSKDKNFFLENEKIK